MTSAPQRFILFVVFFVSGVCGLGHQMVWSRVFGLGLGHELPAVLAVVTAFFGGVALGAWILDGALSRSPRPGRWYGFLELLIGLWGVLLIVRLPQTNELALLLIGIDPSPLRHWTAAFSVPFVLLLPATASMGATLAAMDRFVAPLTTDGKCIGTLYALNTLGAVLGTLLATFLLVPALGFTRTLLMLASLNAFCGVIVLIVERRIGTPAPLSLWNSIQRLVIGRRDPPDPSPLPQGEGTKQPAHPPANRARLGEARRSILPLPAGEGRGENSLNKCAHSSP
ncbi:MAG: fused MFS/spermidine synthase, partial [Verrucomicrobia bacterium]|nr:fused MFS/spermidine synthase [Verrucomicrobiota bacterium]